MSEDKRAAVGMSVTLSGQLMSAALAVMALQAGFVSYVLANRTAQWCYYGVTVLALVLFALSLYFGGQGINKARNAGFSGSWDLEIGKSEFNSQATLCFVGLLLLLLSLFFSGNPKSDDIPTEIKRLVETVASLKQEIQELRASKETDSKNLRELHVFDASTSEKILSLQGELSTMRSRFLKLDQHKVKHCNCN